VILEERMNNIKIRKFEKKDAKEFHEIYSNPNVTKTMGSGRVWEFTVEQAEIYIERTNEAWNTQGYGIFAIEKIDTRKVIGMCGFMPFRKTDVELLYSIGEPYWGNGYTFEACEAALSFAKQHYDWKNLYAYAYPENVASIRIMQKLGFEFVAAQEHYGIDMPVYELDFEAYTVF
jgi:RimJ/RimL family protein N-acetyltransferase